ncbi:MAG: hydroxymethylbilane synthase [Actinomycetota bacterium]
MRLVLATRRSPLALAQTGTVAEALRAHGHEVELLPVVTTGDRRSREGRLPGAGDEVKGLFVKELEEALLAGDADAAVHSAKDLPTELPAGLAVVAVPERVDPRDVAIGPAGGLDALPAGARVGTGSPRRQAQLADGWPGLVPVDIRGNVDTRIGKMARGDVDALLLAHAGLIRLGGDTPPVVPLDPAVFVPAPGQGCLALEARADRGDVAEALACIDHGPSRRALAAERAFLAELGGGCQTPVGALCVEEEGAVTVTGHVGVAGGPGRRGVETGEAVRAEDVARVLARRLGAP